MKILFMCVANSARSQLAEGLAREMFPDAEVRSAGSRPGKLNPFATKVMSEVGLDISNQHSKSIDDLPADFVESIDYLITLCAEEVCPVMTAPRAKKMHWPFRDPASKEILPELESLKLFREVRDQIKDRLTEFQREIRHESN